MARIIGIISVLFILLVLAGCTNQTQDLVKENGQLRAEVQSLKQQVDDSNKKLKEQEELYELRNILDNNLHIILRSLIKGDYQSAKQNLASTVRIENKKLLFNVNGRDYEFIIPDKPMNLRQRAFMEWDDNYTAIYEIYDAGYTSGEKYDDRINTLNVNYVRENGQWKLSGLKIDE